MNKPQQALLFCALCCVVAAPAQSQPQPRSVNEAAKRDEVIMVKDQDPAMEAAFKKARATLDQFFALQAAPPPGTDRYAVKVAIRGNGRTEYFWVADLKRDGAMYSGVLNNTPRLVTHVREGETVRFARADIYDWTYRDNPNRRTMGNFTACALLTHEPPAAAAEFKRTRGLQCD